MTMNGVYFQQLTTIKVGSTSCGDARNSIGWWVRPDD